MDGKNTVKKTERKKICFFSGDITRSGGTERVACMIANGLARRMEYKVCILSLVEQTADHRPFFSLDEKISHVALARRWIQPGPGYALLVPKLRRFLKQQDIDVMIDIDIVLDVLSVPAAIGTKTKVVAWEHFHFGYETAARYGYRNLILRYLTVKTDHIVTLTERDRQAFLHGLKNLPEMIAIPNPMREVPINRPEQKRNWIITAVRLVHEKGIDYLLRTAEIVLKKHPNWQWLLLGDGELREWLETQISRRHLKEQLILKGKVADVDTYLAQAQIFVLTSRVEGLPMCLLEAKAHRLACVSFDIATGPSEMITDGCNGFLVPPYHCTEMAGRIGLLIENTQLRQTFMKNAEIGIEKFQLDAVLNQWDEVLKRL